MLAAPDYFGCSMQVTPLLVIVSNLLNPVHLLMKHLLLAAALMVTIWSCDRSAGNNSSAPPARQVPADAKEAVPAPDSGLSQVKTSTAPCPTFTPKPLPTLRPVPQPLYGVTIESVEDHLRNPEGDVSKQMRPVLESLQLGRRPTVRLVFNKWEDFGDELNTYQKAAHAVREHAYVLGEILDSDRVKELSVDCYRHRAATYVERLGVT
jgi:hypothetical protein